MTFDCKTQFEELFDYGALNDIFVRRFRFSAAKGIDRVNGFQFATYSIFNLLSASKKCLNGTYRFSPYLENLRVKSRFSAPRLISVPTVRDRVVLNQLKLLISRAFPEAVPKDTAAAMMRAITADLVANKATVDLVCGCDIRDFYPSVQHERLLGMLKTRITDPRAFSLITRSIRTPTVPVSTRSSDRKLYIQSQGVPQGLATSNILAAIYMLDVDEKMRAMGVRYYRYVDDILMFGENKLVRKAYRSFLARARARRLRVHPLNKGKTHLTAISSRFAYLGYVFHGSVITVRDSTIERLLESLAGRFSDFRHNKAKRLARLSYLNIERYKAIFLDELNERITGAISEKRRYGWVAYFSQLTDLSILHRLDAAVSGLFTRLPDFDNKPPLGLKRFARAHFEMKFNPTGGYVRNFDAIVTSAQRLAFLVQRGRVADKEVLTDDQIEQRYLAYQRKILGAMQADEGMIY